MLLHNQFLCAEDNLSNTIIYQQREQKLQERLKDLIRRKKEFNNVFKRMQDLASQQDDDLHQLLHIVSSLPSDIPEKKEKLNTQIETTNINSLWLSFWHNSIIHSDQLSVKSTKLYNTFSQKFSITTPFDIKSLVLQHVDPSHIICNKSNNNFTVTGCNIK